MISRFSRSFILSCIILLFIASIFFLNPPIRVALDPRTKEWAYSGDGLPLYKPDRPEFDIDLSGTHNAKNGGGHDRNKETNGQNVKDVVSGGVIMGKLGNETAKAALGRATWKLLHTVTLRFPESPTADEREALRSYFHLSSRLYPCGECAAEFQALLKAHPPQTSSRKAASLWLCYVHNLVNKRLKKEEFDCTKLDSTYDCGCGDDPLTAKEKEKGNDKSDSKGSKDSKDSKHLKPDPKKSHEEYDEHDEDDDDDDHHGEPGPIDDFTGERLIKGG